MSLSKSKIESTYDSDSSSSSNVTCGVCGNCWDGNAQCLHYIISDNENDGDDEEEGDDIDETNRENSNLFYDTENWETCSVCGHFWDGLA